MLIFACSGVDAGHDNLIIAKAADQLVFPHGAPDRTGYDNRYHFLSDDR